MKRVQTPLEKRIEVAQRHLGILQNILAGHYTLGIIGIKPTEAANMYASKVRDALNGYPVMEFDNPFCTKSLKNGGNCLPYSGTVCIDCPKYQHKPAGAPTPAGELET